MQGNIVKVDVINGRAIDRLILIVAATLGIEQLHAHLEIQFLRLVAYTIESIISLIGMNTHTRLYMHHQHPIGIPTYIDTIHKMHLYRHRRQTEIEGHTQQLVKVVIISIDASDPAIIFNAYHHIAAICIGKSHY